jgi:acyl-CoA thioesterase-1
MPTPRPGTLGPGLTCLLLISLFAAACGRTDAPVTERSSPAGSPANSSSVADGAASSFAPARDAIDRRPRVVVLGDSLTAGLGLAITDAFPAQLQQKADRSGLTFEIVNAGVSGDTSAGGLSRLDWALAGDVRVLVVALGANDGLRGLPIEELRHNLSEIIGRAQARHIEVVLTGMEALPNLGPEYARDFHNVFPTLAKQFRIPLVPFLLEGVAGVDALNQRDGIHPTAEGARMVAENVWRVLEPVLRREAAAPPTQ